ncbi:hypothetical protein G9A89_006439 [Geosiphon pyriformis]|nr:hypothetical protein G9A89_006439 [Geosiphon pyriformis]
MPRRNEFLPNDWVRKLSEINSQKFFRKKFFIIQYDKSKLFFNYEATIGSIIAVIKKTSKVSGSEGGFKAVMSKKKRKSGVLTEGVDNRGVAAKASGAHLWNSKMGNTIKSENIDIEEECLVEETSVDYNKSGAFMKGDLNQIPKSLHVKTKKVLGKPLDVIDYETVNIDDNVLDDSFLLLPLLPVKLFIQVPVHKFFALDIDLVAITGKSSQEKVNFVRKIFSGVNGFGGASTLSKFGGIIQTSFTSEKAMMAAAQLANNCGVTIVLKEIPVGTFIEAVCAAISEFGFIKSIKMQLVGLWQKVIIKLENQNQANLLVAEWSILIGKDVVCVAQANVDKQTWDAKDEFRALLYTLPIDTNAHDLWDFIGSVNGKTCVIKRNSVSYVQTHCATVCFNSESSLIQAMANTSVIKSVGLRWFRLTAALCSICKNSGHTSLACHTAGVFSSPKSKKTPLSAQDQFCLVKIYEKKSAPVSHPLAFSGKTWASMVGKPLLIVSLGGSAQSGSISYGKFFPTFDNELEDCLKNIESSLTSLIEQIGKLAQRLDSLGLVVSQPSLGCQPSVTPLLQDYVGDVVMEEGLSGTTSGEAASKPDLFVSLGVKKLESILAGLSVLVMSLTAYLDGLSLTGVAIIMNIALAKHVCKVSKVSGRLISVRLLFKNKLSVSILGLYAGISALVCFSQADDVNTLIARAVNKSSFLILGDDFNEDGLHKSASFRKCESLGLVNSLVGNPFLKVPTWSNSQGVMKTIDYLFMSPNLVNAILNHNILDVVNFFDMDHQAVSVLVGLSGLLDTYLYFIRKQANKDYWKYNYNNAGGAL